MEMTAAIARRLLPTWRYRMSSLGIDNARLTLSGSPLTGVSPISGLLNTTSASSAQTSSVSGDTDGDAAATSVSKQAQFFEQTEAVAAVRPGEIQAGLDGRSDGAAIGGEIRDRRGAAASQRPCQQIHAGGERQPVRASAPADAPPTARRQPMPGMRRTPVPRWRALYRKVADATIITAAVLRPPLSPRRFRN